MQLERDEGMPSWPRFKECCNLRFGPPIRSNPLGKIARMRQSGTVTEYVEKFLSLLAHSDPLTTKQQVQLFTSGLTDLLRRLTAAEMAERREKGLCFNCDEKFSTGHRCQRLFYLEVIDDVEEEDLP